MSGNASWNTARKPRMLSRPVTCAPGAVISASAAHGSASLSRPLNASMCWRITSLAPGICSPISLGVRSSQTWTSASAGKEEPRMTITFLTSRTEILVDEAQLDELMGRLDRSSTIREAIEERDPQGVRLTVDQKHELLRLITGWLHDSGISNLGGFAALRYEL